MDRRELVERAVRRGKYAPLFHHLMAAEGDRIETTFSDLERVLGFSLPDSARLYRPWWANQDKAGHSQAMAWSAAGWKTTGVDLENETLAFERLGPPKSSSGRDQKEPVEAANSFWIYENWTHDKAVIHAADCSYCNDGRGMHLGSSARNGQWLGSFENLRAAYARAAATGRTNVTTCKRCLGTRS